MIYRPAKTRSARRRRNPWGRVAVQRGLLVTYYEPHDMPGALIRVETQVFEPDGRKATFSYDGPGEIQHAGSGKVVTIGRPESPSLKDYPIAAQPTAESDDYDRGYRAGWKMKRAPRSLKGSVAYLDGVREGWQNRPKAGPKARSNPTSRAVATSYPPGTLLRLHARHGSIGTWRTDGSLLRAVDVPNTAAGTHFKEWLNFVWVRRGNSVPFDMSSFITKVEKVSTMRSNPPKTAYEVVYSDYKGQERVLDSYQTFWTPAVAKRWIRKELPTSSLGPNERVFVRARPATGHERRQRVAEAARYVGPYAVWSKFPGNDMQVEGRFATAGRAKVFLRSFERDYPGVAAWVEAPGSIERRLRRMHEEGE